MNPVQKAIADAKFRIPMDILNAAFIRREFGARTLPINIDAIIRDRVIEARVKPDCDLVGGIEVSIPLTNAAKEYIDPYNVVYRVSKTMTQNRVISRVLSITMGNEGTMGGMPGTHMGVAGYSHVLDAAAGVMASHMPLPVVSSANIRLIAENTILVTDSPALPTTVHLLCYLENDADFSQLRSTTYHKFSRLVELAIKAYIHTELVIPIGQGQLHGGMELGAFKEIIDSYADANELYSTYLQDEWRRISILDDAKSRERHLRMITGGRH